MSSQFYQLWQNTVPRDFMQHAACRGLDPNLFMPEIGDTGREGKQICNGRPGTRKTPGLPPCAVKAECLDYALNLPAPVIGIWGGTSERERRIIKRETSVRVQRKTTEPDIETTPHSALRELVNLVHETHFQARREARENARASRTTKRS